MIDFESLPLFGSPFEHVETYVYYGGRRTFSMKSTWADVYYIVNTVDEDEDEETLTTVLVAMGAERFRAVRSGLVTFRNAFTEAREDTVHVVTWSFPPRGDPVPDVAAISAGALPDEWLPYPEARLNLPTETAVSFTDTEIVRLARDQSRTVFALEVGGVGNVTQLPVRTSGELQLAVDGEIEALYREISEPSVSRDIVPMFVGVRAASFVLVMSVESPGLVEPADITATVFERFEDLIRAAASNDRDVLLEELRGHDSRVRNRFKDLLKPLATIGSGLALISSVAYTDKSSRVEATPDQVKFAYSQIEQSVPQIDHAEISRGALIGLNVRTSSFEINDLATTQTYRGHMDGAVQELAKGGFVVGESGLVRARIRLEIPFATGAGETGTRYFLEQLVALDEELSSPDGDDGKGQARDV
ncbi:hypothetical protein ACIRCZ_07675 [Leifsonia sp. NPDC102414]|uniref:hypothetical protein n=1 Tax=Leifsonia sp. NPDC102414 TaxID=3364124 RepID=UPI0037FEFC41